MCVCVCVCVMGGYVKQSMYALIHYLLYQNDMLFAIAASSSQRKGEGG